MMYSKQQRNFLMFYLLSFVCQ